MLPILSTIDIWDRYLSVILQDLTIFLLLPFFPKHMTNECFLRHNFFTQDPLRLYINLLGIHSQTHSESIRVHVVRNYQCVVYM